MPLVEDTSRRGIGVASALGMIAFGGLWGLGALAAVLIGVRQRLQMRWIIAVACVVAGFGAAQSTNANDESIWAIMSILAALVAVACLVVRIDADGDRFLTRASLQVDKGVKSTVPKRRPKPAPEAEEDDVADAAPPPPVALE